MTLVRLLAAAVVLAACSGAPQPPPPPQPQPQPQPQPPPPPPPQPQPLGAPWAADQPGACADRRWGGWDGTPECKASAARLIAGADRACATDADCVKLSASNCDDNVLSTAAAPRYRDWPAPCNDPHAGDCSPSHTVCASGCCLSSTR